MIKAIVLDWHGVLDRHTFRGLLQTIADAANVDIRKVRLLADQRGMAYAEDNISEEEFWDCFQSLGTKAVEAGKRYQESVDIDEKMWEQLEIIADDYLLFILSDCGRARMHSIEKNADLLLFDNMYFSCDYGLTKKTDEFFTLMCDEQQLKPEECVFVDDSDKNIMRAEILGFHTIQYEHDMDFLDALNTVKETLDIPKKSL